MILHLLADYPCGSRAEELLKIVEGMGGVRTLFMRFFRHYDVSFVAGVSCLVSTSFEVPVSHYLLLGF